MKKLSTLLIIAMMASMSVMATKNDASKTENNDSQSAPALLSSISGKVVDFKTGESLAGVRVVLEGTQQETFTDFDGNFSFANLSVPEAKICATYISYQQASVTVNNISGNINLSLKSAY